MLENLEESLRYCQARRLHFFRMGDRDGALFWHLLAERFLIDVIDERNKSQCRQAG